MPVTPAIPASRIVSVAPSVLSAGGTALDMVGLLLTTSTRPPIGEVLSFATADDVGDYFGPATSEAALAEVYFNGFTNAQLRPGNILLAQYPSAAVAAYVRGGDVSGLSLAQLQAITGTLTFDVNGTPVTGSIDLAAATSFSDAASIIATALSVGAGVVTYDSVAGAFKLTSSTVGTLSTITFATGTAAAALKLTEATGAVMSPGAGAAQPGTFMDSVIATTENWATFTTAFEPSDDDKEAFASWTNGRNNRFAYAMWDTSVLNKQVSGPAPAPAAITAADYSGTIMLYENPAIASVAGEMGAFAMGFVASLDFRQLNGRHDFAFRSQTGITPHVRNATEADYLESYGINYYGDWTTPNDEFQFMYRGRVSGPYTWLDSYVGQIWFTQQLQLALMVLLTNTRGIPYDADGYALIEAALKDPIAEAKNGGIIRAGVTLSEAQRAELKNSSGKDIASTIEADGWYVLVSDATPQVRIARASPPCSLWYTDGQNVQRINLGSIAIQ